MKMKGSLEILELLMCLNRNKFLTSSKIRDNLKNYNLNTLNSRLDRLTKTGLIEKKNISGKLKPGGDKIQYKLSKEGNKLKGELIKKAKGILLMDPVEKRDLLKEALLEDENIIANIVKEYSQELEEHIEGKNLTLMIKKLNNIINKNIILI